MWWGPYWKMDIRGSEIPVGLEGMATHSGILAWRIPTDRGAWQAIVRGVARVGQY